MQKEKDEQDCDECEELRAKIAEARQTLGLGGIEMENDEQDCDECEGWTERVAKMRQNFLDISAKIQRTLAMKDIGQGLVENGRVQDDSLRRPPSQPQHEEGRVLRSRSSLKKRCPGCHLYDCVCGCK